MSEKPQRETLIDAFRGAAVVSMVLYHFCYDVFVVFGREPGWLQRPAVHLWQQAIGWTFILVSGYAWRWGRRRALRRGLQLLALSLLITLASSLALPGKAIWWGVLFFLGSATLLLIPLDKLLCRVPPLWGLAASALLFALLRPLTWGAVGLGGWRAQLPAELYALRWLTPLGFPSPRFHSGDYYPLLPWLPLYLCGYFLHPLLQRSAVWRRLAARRTEPLVFIGQRSLWIYLLHQPLLLGLCLLLFR